MVSKAQGASFTAEVWFSTYKEGLTPKLAAIIADVTEESAEVPSNTFPSKQNEGTSLKEREISVLRFLVQGLANNEIASRMEVSESTVKNTQLFAKHEAHTRA